MKKWDILFLVSAVIILFAGLSLASFTFIGQNVKTDYLAGDKITGIVNISFDKEPATSQIISNFIGNISLLDLLNKNNLVLGVDYNCSTQNCLPGYATKSEISTIALGDNEPKIVGFKITGKTMEINSLNLSITSDTPQSCIRQILVNVLDTNEIFIQNPKYTANACDVLYSGCFDNILSSESYQNATIKNSPYCEKITLPPAAAYQFGATVKNSTTGTSDLKIKLYDSAWSPKSECTLPRNTQDINDLKCVMNYTTIDQSDFFVCISNPGYTTNNQINYQIRAEQSGNKCGTADMGSTFSRDYEIFARAMQFDSVNIGISGTSSASQANEYISEKYGGDCTLGCVIPFKVFGKAQNLAFNNVQLRYTAEGTSLTENRLYLLEEDSSKITSRLLKLNLEPAGFVIPLNASGQKNFTIYMSNASLNRTIFSTPVNISASFDFDVNPKSALVGIETNFSVITSLQNVSSSWKFGDGTTGASNEKSIIHVYKTKGTYTLEVELSKSDGTRAKKTVTIIVGDPKESATILFDRYDKRISDVTNQINSLPDWAKTEVEKKLDPRALNNTLSQIKTDYDIAVKDEDYTAVVNKLLALEVPTAVATSKSGTFPLIVGSNNVDTNYIEELSAQKVSEKEKLKADIVSWMAENYDANVSFEVISKFVDSKETPIVTKFKLRLIPKIAQTETNYLFINYPSDAIIFMKAYGEKAVLSGTYVQLSETGEDIEFLLPEYVEVSSLGAYISPDVSRLGTDESIGFYEPETRTGWIIFWLIVLLIATLAGYIVLQEWYKRHYESYLFKNKDDLYNLVNFIYNSRAVGLKDAEVRNKIAKTGWNGEQITYAFKKIDGKRTGMYEIPIFKWLEMRKVKKEIQKRQRNPIDIKFIKRPAV